MTLFQEDLSTPVVDLQTLFQPSEIQSLQDVLQRGLQPSVDTLRPLLQRVLHARPLGQEEITDLLSIVTVGRSVPQLRARVHWTLKRLQRDGLVRLDPDTHVWMTQDPRNRSSEPSAARGTNATAVWLNTHLMRNPDGSEALLLQQLRSVLGRLFKISYSAGMIEDHIHNYFVRAIHRDAFAHMLSESPKLPYGKVISYCVNSAKTDMRSMGVEPICRTAFGARTERERKTPQPKYPRTQFTPSLDTDGAIFSLEDPHSPDEWLDFEKIWAQVQTLIQRKKPHAWERYSQVLKLKLEGYSVDEIADQTGVGSHRATSLIQEARKCVRKANPVRQAGLTSA